MTATVPKIPDPLVVLRRAEQRHTGEEPGDLDHLADAVRKQIVDPLTAGGVPTVDDTEMKQLRFDKQRAEDVAAELRKMVDARDRSFERQKKAFEALKTDLAWLTTERDEARAERDSARAQLRDAEAQPHGGVELMQSDLARLANELATTKRDLAAANRTLDEIADEAAAQPPAVHVCQWPVTEPGTEPGPCVCGAVWPRAVVETEEVVPDVEPWDALFGQIRTELDGRWSA